MRPKFVITVLVAAFGLLGFIALVSSSFQRSTSIPARNSSSTSPESVVQRNPASAPSPAPAPLNAQFVETQPVSAPVPVVPNSVPGTNHDDFVEQRAAELMDLAMNDDQQSLNTILSAMTNSDKAIREAALEAAVQFGDTSAIPRMKVVADQTKDPQEAADIRKAIDYLSLPSAADYIAKRRAEKLAAAAASRTPGRGLPKSQPATAGQSGTVPPPQ